MATIIIVLGILGMALIVLAILLLGALRQAQEMIKMVSEIADTQEEILSHILERDKQHEKTHYFDTLKSVCGKFRETVNSRN